MRYPLFACRHSCGLRKTPWGHLRLDNGCPQIFSMAVWDASPIGEAHVRLALLNKSIRN